MHAVQLVADDIELPIVGTAEGLHHHRHHLRGVVEVLLLHPLHLLEHQRRRRVAQRRGAPAGNLGEPLTRIERSQTHGTLFRPPTQSPFATGLTGRLTRGRLPRVGRSGLFVGLFLRQPGEVFERGHHQLEFPHPHLFVRGQAGQFDLALVDLHPRVGPQIDEPAVAVEGHKRGMHPIDTAMLQPQVAQIAPPDQGEPLGQSADPPLPRTTVGIQEDQAGIGGGIARGIPDRKAGFRMHGRVFAPHRPQQREFVGTNLHGLTRQDPASGPGGMPPVNAGATVEIETGELSVDDLQPGVPTADFGVDQADVAIFPRAHQQARAATFQLFGLAGAGIDHAQTNGGLQAARSGEIVPAGTGGRVGHHALKFAHHSLGKGFLCTVCGRRCWRAFRHNYTGAAAGVVLPPSRQIHNSPDSQNLNDR